MYVYIYCTCPFPLVISKENSLHGGQKTQLQMEAQLLNDSFASIKKKTMARLEDGNASQNRQLQLESTQTFKYHLVLTVWEA